MTSIKSTWSAVVMRDRATWFARVGRDPVHSPTPDWGQTHLTRVVMAAGSVWFPEGGEGTLYWQCKPNVDMRTVLAELRERGCKVSDSGLETGWFTVRRDHAGTVHLAVSKMISQYNFALANVSAPGSLIAGRLAQYHNLTGAAWRGPAGLSGCAAIRETHATKPSGAQPLWRWDEADKVDATRCAWELRGARHNRTMTDTELGSKYIHQFDVRAMYLAAANTAMVGWSAPEARGPQEFDPGRPGYWLVQGDQLDAPHTVVRPGPGPKWLTTPVMSYLAERGQTPEVFDSWTSERGGRYLKPWAERLTAALKVGQYCGEDPCVRCVRMGLKETYKRTVGMMARAGGRIFRPDWRDEVVDRARVNVIRKVDASGYDPLRWNTDSVWIATDEEAPAVGRKLGVPYTPAGDEVWQVGKFRHIRTMTPAEYLEHYERQPVAA
jgi:hypothetical protein